MPYLGILGDYFGIAGTGCLSVVGAPLGIAMTVAGTRQFNKLSTYYADQEKKYPANSWEAIACKIAKWSATAMSILAGTVGSVLFGLSVYLAIEILSMGMMMPFSIGAGVTCTTLLIKYVSKAQLEHVSNLLEPKIAS